MNRPVCRWKFSAAVLACAFRGVALSAQQAPAPLQTDFGAAVLVDWIQPAYPEAARKAQLEGKVVVEFVVGLDGAVSQAKVKESTDGIFDEAAVTAVRQWKFGPALEERKPVESAMEVPVLFRLAQLKQKKPPLAPPDELLPQPMKLTAAKFKEAPDPDYPSELEARKIPGEVQIEFTVGTDGMAHGARVLWASHAAFVESALQALEKTQFEPARQGPLPKPTKMQYPVEFEFFGVKQAEILEANHLTPAGDTSAGTLPTPFVFADPVYPFEHLLAGEGGSAVGEFTVNIKGRTSEVLIVSSTAPEYGAALRSAIETWMFKPAVGDGAFVPVRLRIAYEFAPPSGGTLARLSDALRVGGAGVAGPAGLDQKLRPFWRGFTVYPVELKDEQLKGQAEIEFIIDRDGRARLPRVKSATREEFGWAAAAAINQWVFERPLRKGEAVDVKVSIPVTFMPPKE